MRKTLTAAAWAAAVFCGSAIGSLASIVWFARCAKGPDFDDGDGWQPFEDL